MEATIGHHPELTLQRMRKIFMKHYEGKHRVRNVIGEGCAVDMHSWFSVVVKLQQRRGRTSLVLESRWRSSWMQVVEIFVWSFFVSSIIQIVFMDTDIPGFTIADTLGIILWVVWIIIQVSSRPTRKKLEVEVKSFIGNAPEFK